jgi:site-specific DNA recombinase
MKAIIYTRYSPQRNGNEKESCEVQAAYCEEYAAKKGWEVDGEPFEDREKSGKSDERPGLWAAIKSLKKGDVLLCWKLDRLARNLFLMERIKKDVAGQGGRIVAVEGDIEGDSPEAVMVRQILAAVSEYECKIIAQRTSAALKFKQKNGQSISSKAPYGYRIEGKSLIEVEAEQEAIRYIEEIREKNPDVSRIVRLMNQSKYPSRSGRSWWRRDVERIISNLKE